MTSNPASSEKGPIEPNRPLFRTCAHCKKYLPVTEYYVKKNSRNPSKTYLDNRCKKCFVKVTTARKRKRKQELLAKQGGLCAICGIELKSTKEAHRDHNHRTGKWRGILCMNCNYGLGHFNDSPHLLRKAMKYLEEHNE